jgi:4a-hydroxytetrahydrobiopterin dehydratase
VTSDLLNKHCQACEGGVAPLNSEQARALLTEIHGDWKLNEAGDEISRGFKFKNYYQTIAFVNALAWVSHQEDHHPDLEVGYSRCLVRYSTHAIGGLSENDFICAAKIDALLTAA